MGSLNFGIPKLIVAIRGELDLARPESGPQIGQERVAICVVAPESSPHVRLTLPALGSSRKDAVWHPCKLKAASGNCHRSNALRETSGG